MDVGGGKGDNVTGVNVVSNKGGDSNWDVTEQSPEIEVVVNQDDDGAGGGKPCVGMEFESEDAGKSFYDGYARQLGFSTHVGQFKRAKPDGPIVTWDFACSREVFKRKNIESCNAMFRIEQKDGGKWVATKFVEDHNHSMVTPSKVHYLRPRRHFAGATKNVPETLDATTDVFVSVDGNHVSYEANRVRSASSVEPNRLLYGCINFSEAIEDFESSWSALLDKYDLHKNEWLQAVYNARKQWAPVYFRGTFFATLSSNQGVSSFFDGYVHQQTTIPLFFKQYERALEHSLEKEIEADCDTICTTPVLKTPSPMEQQAANLYTKKVFSKFQEELVETFVYTANKIEGDGIASKYRVAKYEHDHKAFFVTLNVSEMKASCSCQMFEYSGILCRHILTVFTVTNVLTLPSHYILKRWTRNAKSWVGLDDQPPDPQGIETLTTRFNSLCQEAFKLAEEGAVAPETYNTAISALREAGKRIAFVKKNVVKVTLPSSHNSGNSHEEGSKKITSPVSDIVPSLWPWQDAVSPRFNLNDVGAPLADLNQPSMVPVSIHRDSGHPDSTVVLTCFKSMTWVIENKNAMEAGKVAVINLKLHDYGKNPSGETEVQFRLTRITLEPMLRSMAYISQQLSTPVNRVAVINLKLQDTKTTSGETEVKFQVSRDTLGSMLRSMAYIREQL
ncbi:FAR1 DNA binding domain - like 5 [Theobroma cacao]|nr:FAR1 DNA binding domain - like 5 [Theobroma cacao]